ncbi:MAG: flagellar export chaperone FliS [Spirochaetaceae bacterium]
MSYYAHSVNAYKETRVKTAGRGRIIVMLYDEAIKQLDSAVELLEQKTKQLDKVNNAITKAQDIIAELMVSLDFEQGGEIARNLFRLYLYFNDELMEANIKKEVDPIRGVRRYLAELRTAWKQIESQASGPAGGGQGVNIAG